MNELLNTFLESILYNKEFFLRLIISVICGGIIGFERSKRQKEAGLRTHIVVALGSTLIMIISKYGCLDIFTTYGINVDSTRIASNIVTGIGFLGAGVIFVRGASIKGLTTAAGIWSTAGVGMAIGTGMYAIGIFATVIITVIQYILHKWSPSASSENLITNEITITISSNRDAINSLLTYLKENNISVYDFGITKNKDTNTTTLKLYVRMLRELSFEESFEIFDKFPDMITFKINS